MAPSLKSQLIAEVCGTFALVSVLLGSSTAAGNGGAGVLTPFLALFFALSFSFPAAGHVNPAVTLAMALTKNLPWDRVLPFFAAQFIGAFVAAPFIYFLNIDYMDSSPAAKALVYNAFGPVPPEYLSVVTPMYESVLGTMFFLLGIFAVTDSKRISIPPLAIRFMVPMCLMVAVTSFGGQAGGPYNPAADFSPRLFSLIFFDHKSFGHDAYFLTPLLFPFLGATAAAFLYRFTIGFTQEDGEKSDNEQKVEGQQ